MRLLPNMKPHIWQNQHRILRWSALPFNRYFFNAEKCTVDYSRFEVMVEQMNLSCFLLIYQCCYRRLLVLWMEKYVILATACIFTNVIFKNVVYFQNGVLVKVTETCPPLNCSEKDHVLPENQCCSVCRGKSACKKYGNTLKRAIPF